MMPSFNPVFEHSSSHTFFSTPKSADFLTASEAAEVNLAKHFKPRYLHWVIPSKSSKVLRTS